MTDAVAIALCAIGLVLLWRAYATRPPHLGFALLLCASCSPLPAAIQASGATAIALEQTRQELVERRKAEQLEATRAVEGDRSDPAVKAAQRAAAARVGLDYVLAFEAYEVARLSWRRAVGLIKLLRDNPDVVDAATVADALRAMVRARADFEAYLRDSVRDVKAVAR